MQREHDGEAGMLLLGQWGGCKDTEKQRSQGDGSRVGGGIKRDSYQSKAERLDKCGEIKMGDKVWIMEAGQEVMEADIKRALGKQAEDEMGEEWTE